MTTHRLRAGLHAVGIAAVMLLGLAATSAAQAGGRAHVGVWVGGPYWGVGSWGGYGRWGYGYGGYYGYPYGYGYGYGYPYAYSYPSTVIVHQQPTVVVPSAAQQAASWYYCREAQMYYPYVSTCPSPWQEVPATQPPAPVPAADSGAAPPSSQRTAPKPVPPAR